MRADAIVAALEAAPLEIQAGHTTVAEWEARIERVLAEYQPNDPYHKVFAHYADAVPLLGAELVAGWQARIREYPESWSRPAVEHHLKVFPIWAAYDQVVARDAQLWTYQMLVEGAQHVLGMLAGLNRDLVALVIEVDVLVLVATGLLLSPSLLPRRHRT